MEKWAKDLNRHFSEEHIQMANRHRKNAQHPWLLEKCKSKPPWDTTSHQSEWPSLIRPQKKKSTNNKCWRGCGEKGTLLYCWWECKLVQPLWKTVWSYLRKLYIELLHDLAIPLLGIYPDKSFLKKDTCTCMFISGIFTIAKTWKQPKCLSTDEWIKKMWYMCTMECHSATPSLLWSWL